MIDSFKEESEGKCLSNKDWHLSDGAISILSKEKSGGILDRSSESVSVSFEANQNLDDSSCVFDKSESVSASR